MLGSNATRSSTSPISSRNRKRIRPTSSAAIPAVMAAAPASRANSVSPARRENRAKPVPFPPKSNRSPHPRPRLDAAIVAANGPNAPQTAVRIVASRAEKAAFAAGTAAAAAVSADAAPAPSKARSNPPRSSRKRPRPSPSRVPSAARPAACPRRISPLFFPANRFRNTAAEASRDRASRNRRRVPRPAEAPHRRAAAVSNHPPWSKCPPTGTAALCCRANPSPAIVVPGRPATVRPPKSSPRAPSPPL